MKNNFKFTIVDDCKIVLEKDGQSVTLTNDELTQALEKFNIQVYYSSDVRNYFVDNAEKYDVITLQNDTKLLEEITEDYAILRKENDGGDPDCMLDWTECLDKAIEYYEEELEKYLLTGE